jgi:hypothetical protein
MPRQFEDELTQRSRGTRKARERKLGARRNAPARTRERGARSKAQYTTVRGTPIIQGKAS